MRVLRAYSSLSMPVEDSIGNAVEAIISGEDTVMHTNLAIALLDNYTNCGRHGQAEQFFGYLCQARASVSVLLWNIMIKVSTINHKQQLNLGHIHFSTKTKKQCRHTE